MNKNEPHSFEDLDAWLEYVATTADFDVPRLPGFPGLRRNVQSVWLWLTEYENPHKESIETAAKILWLREAESFRGLQPDAASLLQLRIVTADRLIEGFVTKEECPFAYPGGAFQEVIEWLLVHWWNTTGIYRASADLLLRA